MSTEGLRSSTTAVLVAIILLSSTALFAPDAHSQVGLKTYTGTFSDGSTYLIEVPANWNGTMFLFSHGIAAPGTPNPPANTSDTLTRIYLLSKGYALAGTSYATTGYAVESAFQDQLAVLDVFSKTVGVQKRTIAWGFSMGGLITAGLVQNHPDRFAGAVAFCGVLGGGVGLWNEFFDSAFVFKTLLASDTTLQLDHIEKPIRNIQLGEQLLSAAQGTLQGQARIALTAAMYDTPGWDGSSGPQPPKDYATREFNQFQSLQGFPFQLFFGIRADLEHHANGNPSWNTGVDYKKQLELSVDYEEVQALYKKAGLSLDTDLQKLNNAARIASDPKAVQFLAQNIAFNGDLKVPVLTVHTIGDDIATVELEQAYGAIVNAAHNDSLLRQTYIQRFGHCAFTSAETIATLETLIHRLDAEEWKDTDPKDLNDIALSLPKAYDSLGPGAGYVAPAFVSYKPAPFLRPYYLTKEIP
jgi:pimeloyl-ACP methyl ester carboxylesterase